MTLAFPVTLWDALHPDWLFVSDLEEGDREDLWGRDGQLLKQFVS